jgi:peptidoglycan hydrolase-like protein with peptidoglycan-binding domain
MKKYVFIIFIIALTIYLIGCGKKQESIEQAQEPLSIEVSPTATGPTTATPTLVGTPSEKTAEIPLPPQGPYKPTNQEIQTALKNAGYYTAEIDGKMGPLTKKAIKEFQTANKLEADGKVGSKTWAVLSNYLNPQAIEPASKSTR